ncbi:MAG: multidrug transporter [Gammaproteobacteria bacterium]
MAFLLVLASIGGQLTVYLTGHNHLYGLVRLFYVDAENNIPTDFSTLLLFAALLLAVITVLKRKQTGSSVSHWAILSFGFLFMAADEAWSFHERLIKPVGKLLGDDNLGVFYFAWVIPGIALVLVLALFFLRFLLRLPAKTRLTFLMAATLYIGGAIGVELIGGRFYELHGKRNLTYSMFCPCNCWIKIGKPSSPHRISPKTISRW